MANEYVTLAALKATLNLTGETFADADINVAIESASRQIDGFCGRRFYADADANQVRHYTPGSDSRLVIDDLITMTTLKSDEDGDGVFEVTWAATDFILEPLNPELVDGTNRRPWEVIRRAPFGDHRFRLLPRSAQVTGKFGWPVFPPVVVEATSILAHRLLRRAREAPFGVLSLGIDQLGVAIPRVDPDIAALLGNGNVVRAGGIG